MRTGIDVVENISAAVVKLNIVTRPMSEGSVPLAVLRAQVVLVKVWLGQAWSESTPPVGDNIIEHVGGGDIILNSIFVDVSE